MNAIEVIDSTKINDFLDCPRMFWFRHVLGWETDRTNNHLVFGQAWHDAMEHLLLDGYDDDSIAEAFGKFLDTYREHLPEDTDELFEPKTPSNAFKALVKYTQNYMNDNFTTLYTEIGGRISIDGRRSIAFKMDSVLQDENGKFFSLEHKTKGGSFTRVWNDDWTLAVQTGTYAHVLHCLFPPEQVKGVTINGVAFLKTDIRFNRVPVHRPPEQLQNWLFHINHYFDQIEAEFQVLSECSTDEPIMRAFPQNPRSCTKYFGCPYFDFCNAWPNPLKRCDEVPPGYRQRFWNPLEEPVKHEINV